MIHKYNTKRKYVLDVWQEGGTEVPTLINRSVNSPGIFICNLYTIYIKLSFGPCLEQSFIIKRK